MARRIAGWVAVALLAVVVLAGAILLGLDTGPGKRFLVSELGGYETASGISIHAGRIEGSIFGRMRILGLEVRDRRGAFLTAPRVTIDWNPFAYVHEKIDVHEALAPTMTLLRSPDLKLTPPAPDAPLLPDIDLTIGHLRIDRFTILPAVDGRRHIVAVDGKAAIAAGRAQIDASGGAMAAPGVAGGDRFRLLIDAVPKENRLRVDADIQAPAGGLIDSYAQLGKSISLKLGGRGDWARWRGRLAGTAGGAPLADVDLTGDNGSFALKGDVRANALLAPGAATRLAGDLALEGRAVLGERKADVKLVAHSSALAVEAQGTIDLGQSRLGRFRVGARLLTPGAIAPAASGRDVRLDAVIDGPFRTPTIDYRLSAARLGFDRMAIEGLQASGHATIDSRRILIPVAATARRVSGLNASVGGLLTLLTAKGTLAYSNGTLLSDNLGLRGPNIDATAILLADFAKGRYTGAIKGRVEDYQVDGLGRINLATDAYLVPGPRGGFGIAGWVRATTRHLDNAGVQGFLGGNALVTADIGYSPEGIATIRDLKVAAPAFRLSGGSGSYAPDGRIAFRAAGDSAAYGPLTVTATGTIAEPVVKLHADHPYVGLQLTGVDAELVGNGAGGYAVRAKGGSPYGPFAGDFVIGTGRGIRVDIRAARFAGIQFRGAIAQVPAGPFAGTLTLAGSGLGGSVRLTAAGKAQRADVDVTASAARLPGATPVTIGGGVIRATAILTPGAPSIVADASLGDVRSGTTILTSARLRLNYRGGRGTAALVAAGRSGVPFSIAAQARLSPDRILANARGSANGIAFSLAAPAMIARTGAGWRLGDTTIVLPQGQVRLSGSYGGGSHGAMSLRARIANLDLSIVQAVTPGLGLGGKASGTIDYASGAGTALPDARARIDITGFTRTGALVVSRPLDVAVLATSGGGAVQLGALIRRGGATLGRAQARLAPVGGGGGASLTDRLLAAPLSGGIRYNGPAEPLWTLTGIAGQQLGGPIAIAADFGGHVAQPTITGVIRASQLRYENDTYGTVLSDIAIDGRFTRSRLQLASLTARAGGGTVSASGSVGLDAASGFPIDLTATLDNARLARSDALGATVSGQVAVTNGKAGGLIKGDLRLGEVRYQIVRQGAAEVPELTGVHRKGQPLQTVAETAGPAPTNWKLDLRVRAPNQIFVSGMGLEAEWSTDMRITGTTGSPRIVGELDVVRGTFSFSGKRLDLSDSSKVTFDGGPLLNPQLDIHASTTVESISATIGIGGRAQAPRISFTSTPALPQDEVLSRLLFGSSVTTLSPLQAVQLAAALNGLRGSGGGGLNPLGKLRSVAGLDRLRVLGADQATGRGTSVAAGKYIAKNVYVEIITDTRGFTATQLEVALSRALSVLSSTGTFGGSNVSLRYRKDY